VEDIEVAVRTLRSGIWLAILIMGGCAQVRPWQRERLASPAMQFELDPYADQQLQTIHEITEGSTFGGGGPGGAGAGCGCH
jgi:uncharacterized protein DUF4266